MLCVLTYVLMYFICIKEMDSHSALNDSKEATMLNQELNERDAVAVKSTYM